jgi:hypothetical protein
MFKKTFFALLISILALPILASADAPPPPPFTVNFTYEGQKITDQKFYAETLVCSKEKSEVKTVARPQLLISDYDSVKDCTWQPGISADGCSNSQCYFDWTLGEFKIAVYIPSLSKVFVSGIMDRQYLGHYGSKTQRVYDINLTKDGGVVVNNSPIVPFGTASNVFSDPAFWMLLLSSLIATIIAELIVGLIFVLLKKAKKNIFLAVPVGNVVSVPFVWIATVMLSSSLAALYIVEIIAVVFEAWLIRLFSKKALGWKMCLLISAIMNIVSFFVGPYLITFLGNI